MVVRRQAELAPWFLLTFTLPARRASQRVEVWRRLQRLGAVPLGNSGYLLPNDPSNQERFEWLAALIRSSKGEASVLQVRSVDNLSPEQIRQRFQDTRARDYQTLIRELHKIAALSPQRRSSARISRLRHRFQEITAIDFFESPLRPRVEELLKAASRTQPLSPAENHSTGASRRTFRRRLWVTRYRPGIDRVTSAWLIRGFIDPKARFGFVAESQVPRRAVAFDMFQGGFGHRGDNCTFETLRQHFGVPDRRVKILSEIVHDADLCDEKFGRKEGFGLDEVLKGWARLEWPDRQILERGMEMVEGLYRSLL
jgi:hypothetical protein